MQKLTLTILALSMTLGSTTAQNFTYIAGSYIPDGTEALHGERLEVWFDTDFHYADKVETDGVKSVVSSIFKGTTDMVTSTSTVETNRSSLHGGLLTPVKEMGLYTVTVPETVDCPEEGTPVSEGTVLFRFILGSKPNRINDVDNTWNAYLGKEDYNCTAMSIGFKAPAGAKVTGIIASPALDTKDGYGKIIRAMYFDCGTSAAPEAVISRSGDEQTFQQVTSAAPTNDLAVINFKNTSWANGYCGKYVEVAISGVKPGDKVGLRGVQTLYDGLTPTDMTPTPEEIAAEPVVTTGIATVNADANAPVEYYNLQGIRVTNPMKGQLYIIRQGKKTVKTVL